ncbi:uncharacterized protein LOC143918725 [Arctopsyche grandis]|uniref:uncharacterized protein LOC143918725 n=1 Tax=Arctopsyche grandis TaxID=121162 RepID=UPI00406D9FCC
MNVKLHSILILFCFWHDGAAERSPESPIPFRDRNGNVVELSQYVARYKKAGTTEGVQIMTQPGFDISKMESDFQRSHVILFSGQFRSKIGNPPGNLYVLFTEDVRYCNSSALAYEVMGDLILSDMKTNNRNTEIQLLFGHMGRIEITKGLLAHMFRKLDIEGYHRRLNCEETNNDYNNRINDRTSSSGSPCENAILDERMPDTYESAIDDIIFRHNDIVNDNVVRLSSHIDSLVVKLRNAYLTLQRQTSGLAKIPEIPEKPRFSLKRTEELKNFLMIKYNEICDLKNQGKETSDGVSVSQALQWKEELEGTRSRIITLEKQLKAITGASISSRFGAEDEIVKTPYDALLNTANYSCMPKTDIDKCVKLTQTDSGN